MGGLLVQGVQTWSAVAVPLPHWEVTQPSNVFRIFEQGSRLGTAALGLNGLNSPVPGLPDKFEDPGRPNNRSSDRGLGTLNRVDLPTPAPNKASSIISLTQ